MGRSFPGDYVPYFVNLLFTNPGLFMSSLLFMFIGTVALSLRVTSSIHHLWKTVILLSIALCLLDQAYPRPPRPRHRKARPRWKRERKWRRRRLHYHLVMKCLNRPHKLGVQYQRPLCLDGVARPCNIIGKHRRWKKKNKLAKARWMSRSGERALKRSDAANASFLAGATDGRFVLPGVITPSVLDAACAKLYDPSKLQVMLKTFSGLDHRANAQQTLDRLNALRALECNHCPSKADVLATPCVWDTGASNGLTPFRSDFIDYVECDIPVKDVSKVNKVVGFGTVLTRFRDVNGDDVFLPCLAYHLPTADIRLFSPQTYHRRFGGYSKVDADGVTMFLTDHTIHLPLDIGTNLPMIFDCCVSDKMKTLIGPHVHSNLAFSDDNLDCFGHWNVASERRTVAFNSEYEFYSKICCPSVGDEANVNLSGPQKELLLWHWKLGCDMKKIQDMMRGRKYKEESGVVREEPPQIKPTFASTPNCAIPKCTACQLAKMRRRNPKVARIKALPEREGALSRDRYEVGDFVSADQFVCNTPGRLLTGYGREGSDNRYHGGTIFNDAASGIIWVECQVSLGAGETIMAKVRFEEWLWNQAAAEIKHLHSDNGIFTADMFVKDCRDKHQTQSFSGVHAQHQNSRAERSIGTIVGMARTFMIHTSLHWNERGTDDLALWAFAVKHAAWLYNRLPNAKSGLTPLELLTKTKSDHRDLLRSHVWGCPVFVLDPKLAEGHKIPKWNRRSRMAQFMGFSDAHSSLVANVRNLSTGFVSPQYHLVFDDNFQTVFSDGENDAALDIICNHLFETSRDRYVDAAETDDDDVIIYHPPPLDDVWLEEPERRERRNELEKQRRRHQQYEKDRWVDKTPDDVPDNPPPLVVSDDESSDDDSSVDVDPFASPGNGSEGDDDMDDIGQNVLPPPAPNLPTEGGPSQRTRQQRRRNRYEADPSWTRDSNGRLRRTQYACTLGPKQVPPMAARLSRRKLKGRQRRQRQRELGDMALNHMQLDVLSIEDLLNSPLSRFLTLAAADCGYSGTGRDLIVDWIHPFFLQAKAAASKEDNPNWWQAMRGPFAKEYWEAACVEIETLEGMHAWDVIDRGDVPEGRTIIDSTWAFKCKRYPDGLIKKFKARFCARGDQQLEGIDFFETYAPVVQWTTVRLMLILEVLLELKSKQGDVTAAFLHADLEPGESIYVKMPQGFTQVGKDGKDRVLSLRKTLYGLRQSPRAFWKYLTEKLELCDLKQSKLDPCLFVGETVMCIVYVDDLIFWSREDAEITTLGMKLRNLGVGLEQEDDAAGFLGVKLTRNEETGLLEMTQVGLIDRVIEALGLDIGTVNGKYTPAEAKPLVKDLDGAPPDGGFSYSSVVGMLLYLAGHTRPDIAYAVNCAARYMFCPRLSHEKALRRIGRYLKATRGRGLVLNPSKQLKIDNYPDADFAGLYGHEEVTDPTCVKSRTGYVITVADCPVLWQSKLQTETALSTMEAEIVAMAHSCRELFPIMDMVQLLGSVVGLETKDMTSLHVTIHEDNAGALVLAETLPPQFTPRSKHYAIKTIWFREEIHKRGIKLLKIETVEQLGDLFTKGLGRVAFEYLRKRLMGW